MLALHARDNRQLTRWTHESTAILVVTKDPNFVEPRRAEAALLCSRLDRQAGSPFGAVLYLDPPDQVDDLPENCVVLSSALRHLDEGDVVRVAPDSSIRIMFRPKANANFLLVTERCNSWCVMCSQPPRDVDDGFLVDEVLRAIPLFHPETSEIGITGGEPLLLGKRLLEMLRALKSYLPRTAVHVLSNGRLCKDVSVAQGISSVAHPDLMLGIPVYADVASVHDFVVQADGAFDETILGILNLKRCGVPVEVRMVLHRHTVPRLVPWAKFIARNLQFVDHVAVMGLELTGFARTNAAELWIDPVDYQSDLATAITELRWAGVRASIYNHQLCVLSPQNRPFAVKSISDWKNEYVEECTRCESRAFCGGFFSTGVERRSRAIAPLPLVESLVTRGDGFR